MGSSTGTLPPSSHRPDSVTAVWDTLWHHEPTAARDDALLARERRHPRWHAIRAKLTARFGAVEGLRAVELGSGRGDLSLLLAEQGASVTLLDASPRALAQARKRFQRHALDAEYVEDNLLGTMEQWHGAFDVAISSGVIEHFRGPDRTRAIAAHRAVLQPRGIAVISVPHACCPSYRIWKAYCELRRCWPYGFERPYSRKELLARGAQAGFTNMEVAGMGFWQSVGDHLGKGIIGRGPDWAARTSAFDRRWGSTLVLFASP